MNAGLCYTKIVENGGGDKWHRPCRCGESDALLGQVAAHPGSRFQAERAAAGQTHGVDPVCNGPGFK